MNYLCTIVYLFWMLECGNEFWAGYFHPSFSFSLFTHLSFPRSFYQSISFCLSIDPQFMFQCNTLSFSIGSSSTATTDSFRIKVANIFVNWEREICEEKDFSLSHLCFQISPRFISFSNFLSAITKRPTVTIQRDKNCEKTLKSTTSPRYDFLIWSFVCTISNTYMPTNFCTIRTGPSDSLRLQDKR